MRHMLLLGPLLLLTACSPGGLAMEPHILNEPYDVQLALDPAKPAAGDDVTLTLTVTKDGRPVDVLNKKSQVLHLTVVSTNLRDYAHLMFSNFEEADPGVYRTTHTFTEPDTYDIWLDIPSLLTRDHHGDRVEYRGSASVTVSGGQPQPPPEAVQEVVQKPFRITLESDTELMTELLNVLRFTLDRTDGGVPRYFAESDQFYVIASPALDEYRLHHVDHHISQTDSVGTELTAFRQPGKYLVWAELYAHNGDEIETVRTTFILDIQPYVSPSLR